MAHYELPYMHHVGHRVAFIQQYLHQTGWD